jgi:hypothetical protein
MERCPVRTFAPVAASNASRSHAPIAWPRCQFADADGDLVLPDYDIVSFDSPESFDDDYIRPAIGECLWHRGTARLIDLSDCLQDARVHEARQNLAQAAADWTQRLNRECEEFKASMERLLARHASELRVFERENDIPSFLHSAPQFMEAVLNAEDPSLYRAKNPSIGAGTSLTLRTPFQKARADVAQLRKRMINRHKLEIMTLNTEYTTTVREMENGRQADLAQKRAALQTLRNESEPEISDEGPGREAAAPARPSRVIRLSLRTIRGGR